MKDKFLFTGLLICLLGLLTLLISIGYILINTEKNVTYSNIREPLPTSTFTPIPPVKNTSTPIPTISATKLPQQTGTITPTPLAKTAACKISGCSSELCVEPGDSGVSTCVYRSQYACFQMTKCERQTDGKCGWTQTTELKQCIDKANEADLGR